MIGDTDIFSKQHATWTFMIGSIIVSLILLAVSNPTFPFVHGQTEFILTDSVNSKNMSNDFSDGLGSPFYTESTKSTNIKVLSIDPIPPIVLLPV